MKEGILKGKVALITGAGRPGGLGQAIAVALAAAGASVMLHDRGSTDGDIAPKHGVGTLSDLELIAGDIAGSLDGVATVTGDLLEEAAIESIVAETVKRFGRLDILVNNAGIQHVAPLDQFPVEKWDQILAINLTSAFHTTRLALPAMRRSGFGRIINVASAHGLVGSPFKSAYVAAKHGIVGLTKVTALETAEEGITCNAVCPGYVSTPLVESQIEAQAKAHGISRDQVIRDVLLAQQPNKRFATVEELGALTVFLSTDAAASITGIALPVDGGWTAH